MCLYVGEEKDIKMGMMLHADGFAGYIQIKCLLFGKGKGRVVLLGLSVCGGGYVADEVFYHLSNMVTYL